MGTFTGVVITFKFTNSSNLAIQLGIIFFLAQFLTGIVNDYVDFESDSQFQPQKITSKGKIKEEEIFIFIKITAILLFVVSIFLLPLGIVLVILFGTLMAQSYNLKFKDTPLSGLIFVISFGLMALVPYIIEYGYTLSDAPIRFIITGLILAIIAHVVNDLVDYEIDLKRQSNSMTVSLGRSVSISLTILLAIILIIVQKFSLVSIILILIIVLVLITGIKHPRYKLREIVYYLTAVLSLILLYIIPVK
jgi:4-hydroxybenzoate polyprenyltransferase